MAEKFSELHELLYYECDATGRLTLPMLLNIIVKTSETQSNLLGRGSDFVSSFGVTWVIVNYEIHISRMPSSEEKISITTQATSYNKYFCYRDFWIHDQEGKECAFVQATFVMMNKENRKLARVVPEIIESYQCEKLTTIKRLPKIFPVENGKSQAYHVRYLDIDGNHHVNNSKYVDWMMDVLGYDFLHSHRITNVYLKYDKEVEYGNQVESHWEVSKGLGSEEEIITKHQIKIQETVYAEANFTWRSNEVN